MHADSFPIKIDSSEITFYCKRLRLRQFRELVQILESVKQKGMTVDALDAIHQGIKMVITGWDAPEDISQLDDVVDPREAMELIGKALVGMKASEDDQKKSG